MAYCQLTVKERAIIDYEREKGLGVRAIGRLLSRSPSTISRELARNGKAGSCYNFTTAGRLATARRSEQDRLRLLKDRVLGEQVDEALAMGWSAEQTAGRLNLSLATSPISFNAIYRYIARLKERGSQTVDKFLRCPRKRRKKHISPVGPLGKKSISERSQAAAFRQEAGHWEGDTIVSSPGRPAILVFVDRKTRYLLARKINTTGSDIITKQTVTAFQKAGKYNRKTITLDNGREFAGYREIERKLKVPVYFCNPHSPWERPTVENTNGLIRQLTRKVNLTKLTQNGLQKLVRLINNRPRKCLNWLTPAEVFG